MKKSFPDQDSLFDQAAAQVVELGNKLADQDEDADPFEVASGMLAGIVHFWLYSHQPCGDPLCESCSETNTADQRLRLLLEEVRQSAQESEYYHSPHDANAGRA
ncbi:MAG: hypothetical protein M0T84_09110 [Betaproteobacteria bacterium]|nr:hypothetical protein [Betaproteobacteria bacterium]